MQRNLTERRIFFMTYSQEVTDIFNELSKVPLGQMLVDRAYKSSLKIELNCNATLLGCPANYDYRAKRLRSSTSSISVLAHELRHHDQFQRLADMGVHIQNLSSKQKFQIRHIGEADAYAYSTMLCAQLAMHYHAQGDEIKSVGYWSDVLEMQSFFTPKNLFINQGNQSQVNAKGMAIFNGYLDPAFDEAQKIYDTYSSTYYSELPLSPNNDLAVASASVMAAPMALAAVALYGAPISTLGVGAVLGWYGLKIGRQTALLCRAATKLDDQTLLSRVFNSYGQMPDGSNYLQDQSLVPAATKVLTERHSSVKKAIRFSPLYHGWKYLSPKH